MLLIYRQKSVRSQACAALRDHQDRETTTWEQSQMACLHEKHQVGGVERELSVQIRAQKKEVQVAGATEASQRGIEDDLGGIPSRHVVPRVGRSHLTTSEVMRLGWPVGG